MWYYNSLNQYCFIFQGVTYFVKGKIYGLKRLSGGGGKQELFFTEYRKDTKKEKKP